MLKSEPPSIRVRVPLELAIWIKEMARQNHRSINSEFVFSLENEKARRAVTQQALDLVTTIEN